MPLPTWSSVLALHVLMKRKTQSTYQQIFCRLNVVLEENKSVSILHTILIDFEPAAKKAFEFELQMDAQHISIKGCRFHFGQASSHNFDKKELKPLRGLKATWSGARPVLTTYVEWLKKKEVEHATRITQLDEDAFLTKKRVAAYVQLDECIHQAKVRFSVLELLELDNDTPDMLPIILRLLRHVSCLLSNKKNVATAPAAPPVDPAAISFYEPVNTIDATISSVVNAAVRRCPALVHTFLPPCTHQRPAPIVPTEEELSTFY
uniref:MULE transposase domain-containing protein n=1 Tax=Plectus sambesii TaxID=2011161 RepID=A0A914V5M0_9BILA